MKVEDEKVSVVGKETIKETIVDTIKKNPLISLAIATGLGFILAKLLNGKKK